MFLHEIKHEDYNYVLKYTEVLQTLSKYNNIYRKILEWFYLTFC